MVYQTSKNKLNRRWGWVAALPLVLAALAFASTFATNAEGQAAYDCSNGTVVPNPGINSVLVANCGTLLSLQSTLEGMEGSLNWSDSTPITSWDGITAVSAVTRVELNNRRLNGSIPPAFRHLTYLQVLDLGTNKLTGSIPGEFGELTGLTHLYLYENKLAGNIPTGLSTLTNLEHLYLYDNRLSGNFPRELKTLTSLTKLDIHANKLTYLHRDIADIASLRSIKMHYNLMGTSYHFDVDKLDYVTLDWPEDSGTTSRVIYFRSVNSGNQNWSRKGSRFLEMSYWWSGLWNYLRWRGYSANDNYYPDFDSFPLDHFDRPLTWLDHKHRTIVSSEGNKLSITIYIRDRIDTPTIVAPDGFQYPNTLHYAGSAVATHKKEYLEQGSSIVADYSASHFPEDSTVVWNISGTDASLFRINTSGQVTFASPPNYEDPQDANADNYYELRVYATDGTNTDHLDAIIEVINSNEAPAVVGASFAVPENTEGTVATFTASDAEGETDFSWGLSGIDSGLFQISSGQLSLLAPLDYETPQDDTSNNEYEITLEAADSDGATGTLDITVTVTDVNEAPAIQGLPSINYPENGVVAAINYTVTDPEGDNINWTLTGPDSNIFAISNGTLYFQIPPDYETKLDADYNNVYQVTLTATDQSNNSASADVSITVTDVDEPPSLLGSSSVNATENIVGTFATYTAADPEEATPMTWSLTGTDSALFQVHSGHLSFLTPPDYDNPQNGQDNVYHVTLKATDPGDNSGILAVAVTVIDINEPPILEGATSITYPENNSRVVGTYIATDPDGDNITWALGGPDSEIFALADGVLSFQNSPDFETRLAAANNNHYLVTITAADDANHVTGMVVTITVTDDNEQHQVLGPSSISFPGGSTDAVANYTAQDPELGIGLTWTLAGPDARKFILSATGALSFEHPPNYSNPQDIGRNNVYNITVTAADNLFTDSKTVAITVTDPAIPPQINPNPTPTPTPTPRGGSRTLIPQQVTPTPTNASAPAFATGARTYRSVPENSFPGAKVGQPVTAVSSYGWTVVHSKGGPDYKFFEVDRSTGQITVGNGITLNFEAKKNTYSISISAIDGSGHIGRTNVTIRVTNINEPGILTFTSQDTPKVGTKLETNLTDIDGRTSQLRWKWERSAPVVSDNDLPTASQISYTLMGTALTPFLTGALSLPASQQQFPPSGPWETINRPQSSTYTPTTADFGRYFRVTVTYSDPASRGNTLSATSHSPVPPPPPNTSPISEIPNIQEKQVTPFETIPEPTAFKTITTPTPQLKTTAPATPNTLLEHPIEALAREPIVDEPQPAPTQPQESGFPFGWVLLAMAASVGLMLPAGMWFRKVRRGM